MNNVKTSLRARALEPSFLNWHKREACKDTASGEESPSVVVVLLTRAPAFSIPFGK